MKGYEHLEGFTEDQLWLQYSDTKDSSIRDYFIIKYAPLVKHIAGRIMAKIPSSVDFNDLVGYGVIGLMDAIDKFDIQRGNKFNTYAMSRINGSIYDELRSLDWLPRSVRQKAKDIEKATTQLEAKLGRSVRDFEVAEAMGKTIEEFQQDLLRVGNNALISIDENWYMNDGNDNAPMSMEETLEGANALGPSAIAERSELKNMIVEAIAKLPANQQKVLILYYFEELTLKEIGEILQVTESRVSQLHTTAVKQLREYLDLVKKKLNE